MYNTFITSESTRCIIYWIIVLCVGDSKAPPVLYSPYSTVFEWPVMYGQTARPHPSQYSHDMANNTHKAYFTRLFRQSYASYAYEATCCRVGELWGAPRNVEVTFSCCMAYLLSASVIKSTQTPQVRPIGRCRLTYAPAWCRWVAHEYNKSVKTRKGSCCTAL